MRRQFKQTVLELARADERVIVVLGDISVYMFRDFQEKYPQRFYNMGICEQTLISVCSGLRFLGFLPFVHSIGPFITERAMEQIKIDCAYNKLPVNIVSCAGTFDYAWDGVTHHAWTDIEFMRLLPTTQIFQPGSKKEVDFLMRRHYADDTTNYFRLSEVCHSADFSLEPFQGIAVKDSSAPVTVVTAGPILDHVLKAAVDLPVNILYFHTLKPLDQELISRFAHTRIKVVHDSFGLFEGVCEIAGRSVEKLALPDRFCSCYGNIDDVRRNVGLSVENIREFLRK